MVVMRLENDTITTSKDVFDSFAPLEEGFIKTLIPMREVCPLGNPVARSQARRVLKRLDESGQRGRDYGIHQPMHDRAQ